MITIIAKSTLLPNNQAKYLSLATTLVEKSRQEPGCISYDMYQDIRDENTFIFMEVWKDEAAIEKHNMSDHYTTIVPLLSTLRVAPAEVRLYRKIK